MVHIVTDHAMVKQQALLKQLLNKMQDEDETSYYTQFCRACMLHPTKNDEGVIEDVSYFDAVFHMICIGWKIFFAFIPPPHWIGGWACFFGCLCLIGIVTAVVGEFSNLFGCVLGIKPSITAITFVALGTSLPDTFASMAAAKADKYADAAIGNVTGSNSVNVFLGLGLPWVIAAYSSASFIASKGPGGWDERKQSKFAYRFPSSEQITED
jgi:Ca2+/Na+ antiporter